MRQWFVVYTHPREEHIAEENLARQGYVTYWPRYKKRVSHARKVQEITASLFPRYLFLQPGSAALSIAPVRSTLGVSTIVRFGQVPALMRAETVQGIRAFEASRNAVGDDKLSPLQEGVRVRIVDGLLAGLEGLISDVSRQRVIVLLQLIGKDTRVSLSRHQLAIAY